MTFKGKQVLHPRFTALSASALLCLPLLAACKSEPTSGDESLRIATGESLARDLAQGRISDEVIVDQARLEDADLALLVGHPEITRVEIRGNKTGFGDAALVHLAKLPNLEWINVSCPRATDAGMAQLRELPQLRILNLHRTNITDAGLAELAPLEKLELLRFGSPHVTDAGMEHIAALKGLRFLHLIDVPITDAGLASIEAMPQLESFYLDGGKTTEEGLSALVKARPDLHFHQDQQHLYDDPRRSDHSHGHSHGEGHGHSHGE